MEVETVIFEHYRRRGLDVMRVGALRIADETTVNLLAGACERLERDAAEQSAPVRIIFNCDGVDQIMTRALARLLRFRVRVKKGGGIVAMCCLSKGVRAAFAELGMDDLIPVFDTEDEAVAALGI
ncbi:MAG TPA: STAS domain-containing protein [Candidatus Brocadiia bacterium]|nr:STAS domain-containing protein [Candidatus Brocadiia bacterium]